MIKREIEGKDDSSRREQPSFHQMTIENHVGNLREMIPLVRTYDLHLDSLG